MLLFPQNTPTSRVFTSDSSANLMVGCSGPLTPPTTGANITDGTTIMPHPHAQQVGEGDEYVVNRLKAILTFGNNFNAIIMGLE